MSVSPHDGTPKRSWGFATGGTVRDTDTRSVSSFCKLMAQINLIRYSNMDYIFWSSLKGNVAKHVVVSYDIACSWHKNLMSRRASLPLHLFEQPNPAFPTTSLRSVDTILFNFVIPKFHIAVHGKSCQSIYSLNFRRYMARTDGENIERGWAWMNPASLSTREMGPGARHDTLDDQWMAWNWAVTIKLGESLTYL